MNKVLVFIGGYLPGNKYGGPIASISNFADLCGDYLDIYIVTADHDLNETSPYPQIKPGWNRVGKAKVLYLSDNEFNSVYLKQLVSTLNPDVIYLNSFFDAKRTVPLLRIARKLNKRVLIAPRGELYPSVLKRKYLKKKIYLTVVNRLLIHSNIAFQATAEDEKAIFGTLFKSAKDRIVVLENIPSIPGKIEQKISKQPGYLNIVFISRIHPKKNLEFALNSLREVKGKVNFHIYGPQEIPSYWESCERIIRELPGNVNVKYCGIAERQDVHRILAEHDVMILPTLSENYGHSIIEAMVSDCPVLISDNTPWTDLNEAKAGWAIPLSDMQAYSRVLQELINMDDRQYQELLDRLRAYISRKLKVEVLKERYLEVFGS